MFETELNYFISHQDELVKQYNGKTLVLQKEQVIGVYDTPLQAYLEAQKEHKLGTFMIQQCKPGVGAYTVTISSLNLGQHGH